MSNRATALLATFVVASLVSVAAFAQPATATQKPFEPTVGQAGKDVVWVPTPQVVVNKMLELTQVTAKDFVMDLGSGDGITVITAAKRGARAMGIEYNPDMVELAKKNAAAAGVGDRATFVKADLFETDFSKADVITMFLLPSINMKLRPKILSLKAGTRVASNTFTMEDWQADETALVTDGCSSSWCTALYWIVPARVGGKCKEEPEATSAPCVPVSWSTPNGELKLTQTFQMITGTLGNQKVEGRLKGDEITFTAGTMKYVGKVNGNTITGTMPSAWTAKRQ
jgi:precorrin-6B methylase 2